MTETADLFSPYLKGLEYPADKQDLIEAAEQKGAPAEMLDRLNRLEDVAYFDGPAEIYRALAD